MNAWACGLPLLECVAERELDFALIIRQGAINTRATILVGITAGQTELGMVEDVEQLSSELEGLLFRDLEILEG
jgi:hypothetical protein